MPVSWSVLLALLPLGGVVARYGVVSALLDMWRPFNGTLLRAPQSPQGRPVATLRLLNSAVAYGAPDATSSSKGSEPVANK